MMKRLVALVGIAVIAALGMPAAAQADDPVEVTANKTPPYAVGTKVKFTVTGCKKKEEVTWELWTDPPGVNPVATLASNTNGSGKDEWQLDIPGPPGYYFVRATCQDTGVYDDFAFAVIPPSYPPGRPGPGLPEADGVWVPGVGGEFSAVCDPPAEWVRFGVYPFHTANEVRSFTIEDDGPEDLDKSTPGRVAFFIPAWNNGAMYYVLYECGPPASASSAGTVGSGSGSTGSNTAAAAGTSSGDVPASGADVETILRVAVALAAVGTGFLFVARRRRSATA
jgi:hypothetical protein